MQLKTWQDQRSGPVGCLAGNIVLEKIAKAGESFKRLKGVIFISDERMIIGRMCSSQDYLAPGWVHFCNLTTGHHKSMSQEAGGREIFYLMISVSGKEIHYWLIPHSVVGRALRKAVPKKSDSACILRIREQNGKYDMLGVDVTEYKHTITINPRVLRRLSVAEKKGPSQDATVKVVDHKKQANVVVKYPDGRRYKGSVPLMV